MFIVAPLIILITDASEEISIVFNVNDEESNKKETAEEKEIKIIHDISGETSNIELEEDKSLQFYFRNYDPLYLQQLSPPPEGNIL